MIGNNYTFNSSVICISVIFIFSSILCVRGKTMQIRRTPNIHKYVFKCKYYTDNFSVSMLNDMLS